MNSTEIKDYLDQGYEPHTQFIIKNKEKFMQILLVKEEESGELSCALVCEYHLQGQSAFSAMHEGLHNMERINDLKEK